MIYILEFIPLFSLALKVSSEQNYNKKDGVTPVCYMLDFSKILFYYKLMVDEIFKFPKNCTVEELDDIHRSLIGYIEGIKILNFDLSNVEIIDISFIQLFCALCKRVIKSNKKIKLYGELPENIKNFIITVSGKCPLESKIKCPFNIFNI